MTKRFAFFFAIKKKKKKMRRQREDGSNQNDDSSQDDATASESACEETLEQTPQQRFAAFAAVFEKQKPPASIDYYVDEAFDVVWSATHAILDSRDSVVSAQQLPATANDVKPLNPLPVADALKKLFVDAGRAFFVKHQQQVFDERFRDDELACAFVTTAIIFDQCYFPQISPPKIVDVDTLLEQYCGVDGEAVEEVMRRANRVRVAALIATQIQNRRARQQQQNEIEVVATPSSSSSHIAALRWHCRSLFVSVLTATSLPLKVVGHQKWESGVKYQPFLVPEKSTTKNKGHLENIFQKLVREYVKRRTTPDGLMELRDTSLTRAESGVEILTIEEGHQMPDFRFVKKDSAGVTRNVIFFELKRVVNMKSEDVVGQIRGYVKQLKGYLNSFVVRNPLLDSTTGVLLLADGTCFENTVTLASHTFCEPERIPDGVRPSQKVATNFVYAVPVKPTIDEAESENLKQFRRKFLGDDLTLDMNEYFKIFQEAKAAKEGLTKEEFFNDYAKALRTIDHYLGKNAQDFSFVDFPSWTYENRTVVIAERLGAGEDCAVYALADPQQLSTNPTAREDFVVKYYFDPAKAVREEAIYNAVRGIKNVMQMLEPQPQPTPKFTEFAEHFRFITPKADRLGRSMTNRRFTPEQFGQICDALKSLHRAGIAHNDVQLQNLFLAGDVAYISDFGRAILVSDVQFCEFRQFVEKDWYLLKTNVLLPIRN